LHEGGTHIDEYPYNLLIYLKTLIIIRNFLLCLNEFKKNLAALGNCSLRCSTTGTPDRYVPVGDLDRSPLIHSYCYASAGDQSILFSIFPLIFVPFMQHAG